MRGKLLKNILCLTLIFLLLLVNTTAFAGKKHSKKQSGSHKKNTPITTTGLVKKFSVSIYMQGKGYYLQAPKGKRYLLKSKKYNLKLYLNKEVKIKGRLRNSVNARIGVIEVSSVAQRIELIGYVKPLGPNIFMEGSGFKLETNDGINYLLSANKNINYNDYLYKKVKVLGFSYKTVEGNATIIDVTMINILEIEITGTINKFSVSVYMQGSEYYLRTDDGTIYLLENNLNIKYEDYLNKSVKITGFPSNAVEGGATIINVTSII